jgi:signal transduction histidine kinase
MRRVATALAYVGLYVLVDWLSYVRPVLNIGVTPWSPEAGLTLAFLLRAGPGWAPFTALAALLSELFVHASHASLIATIAASLWIGLGYGTMATLLRRWRLAGPIQSAIDGARFASIAVSGTFIVAAGYVGFFIAAGNLPIADARFALFRYGFGDLNGILMVTPLLLQATGWRETLRTLRRHARAILAQFTTVLVTLLILFELPAADQLRFFYLLFVPIIWIAMRWSLSGALFAVLAIQVGLVLAAWLQIHTPRFAELQFLLLTLSLTAFFLGAVVTDRQRAEEQLRERDEALARAMRFATAGELASALAHELNQPITALVSYLRASEILAQRASADEQRLQPTLSKAAQEAMRASEVLRRLRDFYRGGALKRDKVNIAALCATAVRAFEDRLRRADVSITVQVDAGIPDVEGDATQMEIVLHNLLANAIDSLQHSGQRVRRIELHASAAEGSVILRVEDSGPGLAVDVSEKLFEPFVTSKPDGMGLGLAISRSLVRARGGELQFVASRRLGGACFTVQIPVESPEVPADA